ncbi:MAG: hypothetical protein QW517_03065, partial [Thermofilaceae archaeon]
RSGIQKPPGDRKLSDRVRSHSRHFSSTPVTWSGVTILPLPVRVITLALIHVVAVTLLVADAAQIAVYKTTCM